jgi:hypothetical protein
MVSGEKHQSLNKNIMKNLLNQINEKIDHFQTNASAHVEKDNKAAGMRARKASLDLEKQLKQFRKKSLEDQKK